MWRSWALNGFDRVTCHSMNQRRTCFVRFTAVVTNVWSEAMGTTDCHKAVPLLVRLLITKPLSSGKIQSVVRECRFHLDLIVSNGSIQDSVDGYSISCYVSMVPIKTSLSYVLWKRGNSFEQIAEGWCRERGFTFKQLWVAPLFSHLQYAELSIFIRWSSKKTPRHKSFKDHYAIDRRSKWNKKMIIAKLFYLVYRWTRPCWMVFFVERYFHGLAQHRFETISKRCHIF